ncbi:hypothetical protein ACEYW6_10570 [Nostoc sp. UIC 10607]|uniref:hypothetical protein n=1 Tax=Nostoc sp. UIC 10607 TaxID=3045935 RepID=UPI0039A085B0
MVKGIAFPLTIEKGNLKVSEDADLYKGHILSWLKTENFERVMRPEYGLKDYLFESIQDISFIASSIQSGLETYIPEVNFEVEGNINDLGESEINVYWTYDDSDPAQLRFIL